MKRSTKHTLILGLMTLLTGCDDIGSIGDKPVEQYQEYVLERPESSIAVTLGVKLDDLEKVITQKFSAPISGVENGEFKKTFTLKTDDPWVLGSGLVSRILATTPSHQRRSMS